MRDCRFSSLNGGLEDLLNLQNDLPAPDALGLAAQQMIVKVVRVALNPVTYKLPEAGLLGHLAVSRSSTSGIVF